MANTTLDQQTLNSLAGKLDQFSEVLSNDERGVLLGLLGLAGATLAQAHSGIDTEGVEINRAALDLPDSGRLPQLSEGLREVFKSSGVFDPAGPVSNSVGVSGACVTWTKDYQREGPEAKINPAAGGILKVPGLKQTLKQR